MGHHRAYYWLVQLQHSMGSPNNNGVLAVGSGLPHSLFRGPWEGGQKSSRTQLSVLGRGQGCLGWWNFGHFGVHDPSRPSAACSLHYATICRAESIIGQQG